MVYLLSIALTDFKSLELLQCVAIIMNKLIHFMFGNVLV